MIKLSQEAKNEMRCFILKTVVHKVSEIQFLLVTFNVRALHLQRLIMALKLAGFQS